MTGYVTNLEKKTADNETFRTVLFTAHYCQLVVMSLKPGEDIGAEVHGVDQFIRIEKGSGIALLDGKEHHVEDGFSVVIPAGTEHNIINGGTSGPMKLYTVYATPDHKDGIVHQTKKDAKHDEPFDGHVSKGA